MSGLPRRLRLRKRSEFVAVQTQPAAKYANRAFVVMNAQRDSETSGEQGRIGITVSKRVGNAITRNRIKRWVREFARARQWAGDRVVVARPLAASLSHIEFDGELSRLWHRWGAQ